MAMFMNLINALYIFAFVLVALILFNLVRPFVGGASSEEIPGELSLRDILTWAENIDSAIERITKSYEWRINQWSGFGNAILTSILAFISTVAVAFFKQEIKMEQRTTLIIVLIGVGASIASYAFCQKTITRLKGEFLSLYNILLRLKP